MGRSAIRFGVFLVVVAVATSALHLAFASSLTIPPNMGPGLLRIASVSMAPAAPSPGEPVEVTVRVEGVFTAIVALGYAYDFGYQTSRSGRVAMTSAGDGTYNATIGGFPDGSDVWFLVAASSGGNGPVLSEPTLFQVGTVQRGGPSSLRIADVDQSPERPWWSAPVTVTARVPSNATVADVAFTWLLFRQDGGGSTGNLDLLPLYGEYYQAELQPSNTYEPVVIAYRLAARDDTGNTAVSDVHTFEVELPMPVP